MNELEPLCNFEQSKMLKKLEFEEKVFNYYFNPTFYNPMALNDKWNKLEGNYSNHNIHGDAYVSRPTISLAKNWLYEKYGYLIETNRLYEKYASRYWGTGLMPIVAIDENPHTAESDCLTEVLKKLTYEKTAIQDN